MKKAETKKEVKKPIHPWRAFNQGWLAEKKQQKPHGAIL